MRFFSQLDLSKVFERALRRSGLPLYLTQGYRPRLRLSFGRALKVGREGESEVIFYFPEPLCPEMVRKALQPQLPPGLQIQKSEVFNG